MAEALAANSTAVDLTEMTYCVVTGASKGIGRAIAIELSQRLGPRSVMLLLARNEKDLISAKEICNTPNVRAVYKVMDLAKASVPSMREALAEALGDRKIEEFTASIIFHNVGSLGDLAVATHRMDDNDSFRDYYDLNVFNVVSLNTQFLKLMRGIEERAVIVNITSLCALKPMAGLAYYCSGKAAREMYFRVLAEEMRQVKVLNYSPGPVETSMIDYILDEAINATLKEVFESFKKQQVLLKPEVTARKCMRILEEGRYKSGDHIDYFDDE